MAFAQAHWEGGICFTRLKTDIFRSPRVCECTALSETFNRIPLFVVSREQDAKIKGEYQEMTGQGAEHKNVRKQRVIRRIQEYKKFRSNCQRLREFIKEKHQLRQNVLVSHKVKILSVGGRSKSEEALLRRGVKNDRLMGRLCVSSPNLSRDLSLEEAIYLWRLKRDR